MAAEVISETVQIALSATDKERLRATARARGLTMTAMVRHWIQSLPREPRTETADVLIPDRQLARCQVAKSRSTSPQASGPTHIRRSTESHA